MKDKRSQAWEFDGITTACVFPDGFVAAGSDGVTDYELNLGTGYVCNLGVSYYDASGTNELIVRVYDQGPYRDQVYLTASVNSRTGLYLPGGNTDINAPTGAAAVVGDVHPADVATGTAASRWREVVDSAVGTPASSDPKILGSYRIPVNTLQTELSLRAHCLRGMAIEVVGVASGGALAAVDHVSLTVTWEPRATGATRADDTRYGFPHNPTYS